MNNARFEHNYQSPDGNRTEVRGMNDVSDFARHPSMRTLVNTDLQVIPDTSHNAPAFSMHAHTRASGRFMQPGSSRKRIPHSVAGNDAYSSRDVSHAKVISSQERNKVSSHFHAGDEEELDGGNANEISKGRNPKREKPAVVSRPSIAEWQVSHSHAANSVRPITKARHNTSTSDCDDVVEVRVEPSQVESVQSSLFQRVGRTVAAPQAGSGRENSPRPRKSHVVFTSQGSFGKSRKLDDNKLHVKKEKQSDDVECVEVVSNTYASGTQRQKRELSMSRKTVDSDFDRNLHPRVSPNVADLPNPPRRKSARIKNKKQSSKIGAIDKALDGASSGRKSFRTDAINLDPEDKVEDDHDPEVGDGVQEESEPARESAVYAQAGPSGPTSSHVPEENVPAESEEEPIMELFDYPPTGRGKIRITSEELNRLRDHQYLNDSLIDFYVKYLEITRNSKRSVVRQKASCLFFSSFFFGCLRRQNPVDYDGVKRWTNNVDLFEKQFVFVPLCDSYHWSLIIVANLPNLQSIIDMEIVEAVDAAESMGERRPKIIYMDSLEPKRGRHFGPPMIEYLAREWIHRKTDQGRKNENTDALCENMFKKLTKIVKVEKPHMPLQSNEYDCGLYVLKNMECFLDEVDGMREEVLVHGSLSKNIKSWYTHAAIQKLRTQIMCLIKDMESCFKSKRSPVAKRTPSFERSPMCITGSSRAKTRGGSNSTSPFAEKKETLGSSSAAITQVGSRRQAVEERSEKMVEVHEAACVAAASQYQRDDGSDFDLPRNASDLENLPFFSESSSRSPSRLYEAGVKEGQERKAEPSSAPMEESPTPSCNRDIEMRSVPIDEGHDAMVP